MEIVLSNLTVGFEAGNEGPPDIVLRQDSIEPPYGHALIRMYHVGEQPRVLATSGFPVYVVNDNVQSSEREVVSFQGETEASFAVPNISNVALQSMGRFYGMQGQTVSNLSFTVDAARGILRASEPIYGTVMTTYNSKYQRLQTRFQEIPGATREAGYVSEFADMVVMAYQSTGEKPASLTLRGPERRSVGFGPSDKSTGEAVVLEVDSTYPVSLSHRGRMPGLSAVARVWAYSTHGNLSFTSAAGLVETPRVGRYTEQVVQMEETLTFVGAQSVSTKYPPINGVTILDRGTATSTMSPGTDINFLGYPQTVTTANWREYGLYNTTGTRQVETNEVVAVTRGIALPVTGQIRVRYNTRRTAAIVYWGRNSVDDWFTPEVLCAKDGRGNTASIVVNPPERRGI